MTEANPTLSTEGRGHVCVCGQVGGQVGGGGGKGRHAQSIYILYPLKVQACPT